MSAQTQRTLSIWRSRLVSALRTAVACAIVACATLYSPQPLRRYLAFPGLSYGVAIRVFDVSTVGDSMRRAAFTLYGTLQGVLPAMMSLWLIGPAHFTLTITTLVVALSAFLVALPESNPEITRGVALNQIVLVYFYASRQGGRGQLHPISVLVSTAVGVLASLLASLFPFPKLACYEVSKKSKLVYEIASVKQKLLINALFAENSISATASLSQAESLTKSQGNLLKNIQLKQAVMQWEKLHTKFYQTNFTTPSDGLQAIEMHLKGMEIALTSQPSFPIKIVDQELKDYLLCLTEQISQTLRHFETSTKIRKTEKKLLDKPLKPLQILFSTQQDLPTFFFLFCIKLLHNQLLHTPVQATFEENSNLAEEESANSGWKEPFTIKKILCGWPVRTSTERLKIAVKCSLSMGLSMLFGFLYSKDIGYSVALTAANCITPWREATFMVANVRVQGTVLGSIYGILGCFIPEKHAEFRFLFLLPWFLCTSFLRHSQMYQQTGGTSAISAAITILSVKKQGSPSEFAMNRITETFIGLSCFIVVELLVQPTRAATLAKFQLSQSLGTLCDCVESMASCTSENKPLACFVKLKEKEKNLREQVNALHKRIEEAKVEPNFWFFPFPRTCYCNLLGSLSKMAELLPFGVYGLEILLRESDAYGVAWKDLQPDIHGDLQHFSKVVGSSLKTFKEISQVKSLASLEMELQRKGISSDIELGKLPNADGYKFLGVDEEELEKIVGSFLQHAKEATSKINVSAGEEELKSQMVLCLSAMGFCISGLMKETREIEKGIKELVQWENPSRHINLYEISCKINDSVQL